MDELSRMKLALLAVVCLAALIGPAGCDRRQDEAEPTGQAVEDKKAKEQAFLAALRTANAFCEAWRAGDFSTARRLMSERLIRRHSEGRLNSSVVPPAGGEHVGYLLSSGKHLSDGRVAFKLQLFFVYAGLYEKRLERPVDRIVLIGGGDDPWKVDEFPIAELSAPAFE